MRGIARNIMALVLAVLLLTAAVGAAAPDADPAGSPWTLRSPTLARSPNGSLWAAWVADTGTDWEIVTSHRQGDSQEQGEQWAPLAVVAADPGRWDDTPSLVFDAEGVAWLAWSSSTGTDDTLRLSHWTGGGWSEPIDVPAAATVPNRQPVLAAAPGGGLWLAWVGFDGVDDEIYAAFWDGVAWSAPQRVGADDADPGAYDTQPRLAAGPGGEVWLAWVGHQALYDTEVFVSHWDGARWSAELQVSADDGTPDISPALAVDAGGRVWLAWQGWADAPDGPQARIFAATGSARGEWNPEELVSSPLTASVFESQPSLALDAQGQPHLAWTVTGSPSGLGYTAFDGRRWLSPLWAARDVQADDPVLLFDHGPQVYWPESLPSGGELLHHRTLSPALSPLDQTEPPPAVDSVVVNRHMAFGDSITWGGYVDPSGNPVGPYPTRLGESLDYRVIASEVVNRGQPSERTGPGSNRLKEEELPAYHPNFVEIMEGTNDVTHHVPYDEVAFNLYLMVHDSKHADAKPLLATLIPRLDSLYDETQAQNGYIASLATSESVPFVDTWSAFLAAGNLEDLYADNLHPNSQGMEILANTFYTTIINSYSWLHEETEPPTTWISSLPAETVCGQGGTLSWTGTDNLSWVVDYDVQIQVNSGAWSDWLLATTATSAAYDGYSAGTSLGFRVRGRDLVGNQSDYSTAQYTTILDDDPPDDVQVGALPAVQMPPFQVHWWATDACSTIARYDVEYRIGAGSWVSWLTGVSATSATFGDDEAVQYGQTYSFRVRAYDAANHWAESAPVSTLLARYVLSGQVFNVRHEPVVQPQASLTPEPLAVQPRPAGYAAYLAGAGTYDVSLSRDGFGLLPPMRAVSVTKDMAGLDFVLPPLDNVVADGGFEAGGWGDWLPGGPVTPTLIAGGHTGDGAALLGGPGGAAQLSQPLLVPVGLDNATLSFLVRLDDSSAGSSAVRVELLGAPISYTRSVKADEWLHVWFPVEAAVGQAVTLTLTVSDSPAVRLDELSLGSAASGGTLVYMPLIAKAYAP